MSKRDQNGAIASGLSAIVLAVLLLIVLIFAIWAFLGRQDYKNKSDQKAAAAVASSKDAITTQVQAQFAAQAKLPYKTFAGPATFGTVSFHYPRTWSAYIDQTDSNEPINGYFYPDFVPGTSGNTSYALRVELVTDNYADVISQLNSQVTSGGLKAKAYIPPKMMGVTNVRAGTLFTGAIDQDHTGEMLVIKVRDKTLQIYTQSNNFKTDFENVVLKNLSFIP